MDGVDVVMDLSVRNSSSLVSSPTSSSTPQPGPLPTIVRPIPRPPWSIVWYQNLWSSFSTSAELEDADFKSGQVFDCFKERSIENANNAQNSNLFPRNQYHSRHHQVRVSVSSEAHDDNGGERRNLSSSSSHLPSYYKARDTQYYSKTCSNSQQPDWENNNENKEPCSSDIEEVEEEADDSTHIVVTSSTAGSVSSSCSSTSNMNETNNRCTSSSAMSLGKPDLRGNFGQNPNHDGSSSVVLDIACCDGPVQFKRVSNPNFALTVEHNDVGADPALDATKRVVIKPSESSNQASKSPDYMNKCVPEGSSPTSNNGVTESCTTSTSAATTSLKTYLCIYCNQSFKSLFCYQKHKKRHLNPVSVDITTTTTMSNQIAPRAAPSHHHSTGGATAGGSSGVASASRGGSISESTKAKMKDLNVQFFPCKKCGCKFPSYYFVHKHRKICH